MRPNSWIWFLLVIVIPCGYCCKLAEIGQKYTITSTANVPSGSKVIWQLNNGTIVYDSESVDPDPYPDQYVGSLKGLTILNVAKNDETKIYLHSIDGDVVYTCELKVYKTASAITCEDITFNGIELRTTCTTAEVYPEPSCVFDLYNNGTRVTRFHISHSSKQSHPQPGGNYYKTSCLFNYRMAGQKPGNWTVEVEMYHYFSGSSTQSVRGRAVNIITMSVPTVDISTPRYCPLGLDKEGDTYVRNGYIRQGERASCLCTLSAQGNPPGTVGWNSTQRGTFDVLLQSDGASTIQIKSPDTFTCTGITVLKEPHNMTYTPKYAYGPSFVSLTSQLPGSINLCSNQLPNIDITCQVPVNNSNPAPLFTIRDGTGRHLVTRITGDTAWSKTVNYTFTKSGHYTFTCRVENAIFSDMFIEAPSSVIHVYEPPSDPPMITARSSQHGDILIVGDDVIVICDVMGGYPSVQSVTMTCGHDQDVTSNGTSVVLTLKEIGQKYNGTICTCRATHVTGCYDLMGVLSLTVHTSNPSKARDSDETLFTVTELVGVAAGGVLGLLVLAIVIALIVFCISREKRKDRNRTTDEEYDTTEMRPPPQYQNVRSVHPNYQTIDFPGQIQDNR